MSINEWENELGIKDRRSEDEIKKEMDESEPDDPFPEFIATLSKEEMLEIKEHEWKYMLSGRFGDEIRKIFEKSDHEMILHVAKAFDWEEIESLLFDFEDADWDNMTKEQWIAAFKGMSAKHFKETVLDNFDDVETIKNIFSNFDKASIDKYHEALSKEIFEEFSDAEWQYAFSMEASEFKKKFLDKMNFEAIYDFICAVDEEDLDEWFINLIGEDYK